MIIFLISCRIRSRCSSVVEHFLGKEGVDSPILSSGTIKNPAETLGLRGFMLPEKQAGPTRVQQRPTSDAKILLPL